MSTTPVRWFHGAVLRLRPVAKAIATADGDLAVYRLQLAIRGWNGAGVAAMRDLRWALDELRTAHPGLPIVLVGHSMGARTSFRLADEPVVVGVVGLAPWLPADEPVNQLRAAAVRIIHGTGDRVIPEHTTEPYLHRVAASGVTVDRTLLSGTGHAMLRRWREWHALAAEAVAKIVDRARIDATTAVSGLRPEVRTAGAEPSGSGAGGSAEQRR